LGDIYADEWAYLVTHSWLAVRQHFDATLTAFEKAGGRVVRVMKDGLDALLLRAQAEIPGRVLRVLTAVGEADKSLHEHHRLVSEAMQWHF
jgi:hypothetical protein